MKMKQYNEAFKQRAVKFSYETSKLDAARKFGVSFGSIVRWRKKYEGENNFPIEAEEAKQK